MRLHSKKSKSYQYYLIANLINMTLTPNEISVLELGLKHGGLLRPEKPELISIVENVSE